MTPAYLAYWQRMHWNEYSVRERLYMKYSNTVGGDNPNGYCEVLFWRCLKIWHYTEVDFDKLQRAVLALASRIYGRHPRAQMFIRDKVRWPHWLVVIDGDMANLFDLGERRAVRELGGVLRRTNNLERRMAA
jgi:hypothetical protein